MASADLATRAQLRHALDDARRATDALFALLTPDAFTVRPIAERHRLVFYLGHLEAFDWNLVCRDALKQPSKHAAWEQLFAFGIDPVDGQLPSDTPADWPSTMAVREWGLGLRADVDDAVASAPFDGWLEQGWALRMALEHRWMHAETLAYLFHRLPHALKRGHDALHGATASAPQNAWVSIPAGTATLGLARATDGFRGWDNEYERHTVEVPAFRMQRYAVSNFDFLRFMDAGGYRTRRWWTPEDWAWREAAGVTHPAFWAKRGDGWLWRGMFEDVALPLAWPAWVSLAEARAWARWAGRALPTEAQWHRAALGTPEGEERSYPWGDEAPRPGVHGAFGFSQFDPSPVDAHPAGESAFGVHGLVGNGWQWTRTPFAPFDGFEPLPFYRGYSANFFDGKHFVMKGAGPRTALPFLRASFRNWFQPHYPHVHASFRCVED